jgi:hypothetical protein
MYQIVSNSAGVLTSVNRNPMETAREYASMRNETLYVYYMGKLFGCTDPSEEVN